MRSRRQVINIVRREHGSHTLSYLPTLALFEERNTVFDYEKEWINFANGFDPHNDRVPLKTLKGVFLELSSNLAEYVGWFNEGLGCKKDVDRLVSWREELQNIYAPEKPNPRNSPRFS